MSALVALTLRTMSGSRRDADLLFAALAPVGCFLGFTLVLGGLIRTGSMSYPQYVLPVVIVQAMLFGAMTTADRAARDRLSGFGSRLRTLPLPASVPLGARMLYCLTRALIALTATMAAGWSFGFRMQGGPADAVLFVTIVVVFAMAVCLAPTPWAPASAPSNRRASCCFSPNWSWSCCPPASLRRNRFRRGWHRSFATNRYPRSPRRCAALRPVTSPAAVWRRH